MIARFHFVVVSLWSVTPSGEEDHGDREGNFRGPALFLAVSLLPSPVVVIMNMMLMIFLT